MSVSTRAHRNRIGTTGAGTPSWGLLALGPPWQSPSRPECSRPPRSRLLDLGPPSSGAFGRWCRSAGSDRSVLRLGRRAAAPVEPRRSTVCRRRPLTRWLDQAPHDRATGEGRAPARQAPSYGQAPRAAPPLTDRTGLRSTTAPRAVSLGCRQDALEASGTKCANAQGTAAQQRPRCRTKRRDADSRDGPRSTGQATFGRLGWRCRPSAGGRVVEGMSADK